MRSLTLVLSVLAVVAVADARQKPASLLTSSAELPKQFARDSGQVRVLILASPT
jgi:hypothetical protein